MRRDQAPRYTIGWVSCRRKHRHFPYQCYDREVWATAEEAERHRADLRRRGYTVTPVTVYRATPLEELRSGAVVIAVIITPLALLIGVIAGRW